MTFKLDTREFDRALEAYVKVSERAIPDIINKKAFFIARRAVVETPKANRAKFVRQLTNKAEIARRLLGYRVRLTKAGVKRGAAISESVKGAPLAALIVNARRRRAGQKGLAGPAMAEAVNALVAARSKSVAFLKSGWLPAIRILEPLVTDHRGEPRLDYRGAQQIGQAKGSASPAQPGWNVRATIENAASAKRDRNEALIRYGLPALQRAFDFEARSMLAEVDRRLVEEAKKLAIKVMG